MRKEFKLQEPHKEYVPVHGEPILLIEMVPKENKEDDDGSDIRNAPVERTRVLR